MSYCQDHRHAQGKSTCWQIDLIRGGIITAEVPVPCAWCPGKSTYFLKAARTCEAKGPCLEGA